MHYCTSTLNTLSKCEWNTYMFDENVINHNNLNYYVSFPLCVN